MKRWRNIRIRRLGGGRCVKLVLEALVNPKTGAISSLDEIGAVGHRIVHGGEAFTESTLITDEVIAAVERVSELAPRKKLQKRWTCR